MKDLIEDFFKIYLSAIESYNSKICQTVNDKYTVIDRSMIAVYLFVKVIEDRNERNQECTDTLVNYLFNQIIYSETGNIVFEISDDSRKKLYHEILEKIIVEKFEYKNRIMTNLKYNYRALEFNKYSDLILFFEDVADFSIFSKMLKRGNQEVIPFFNKAKEKVINYLEKVNKNDYFYKEKEQIINLIIEDKFNGSQYGNLVSVVLNLADVYRYSQMTSQLPENVLLHQYMVTIMSIMIAEYSNRELGENIDIYTILVKSLFHDFSEYKGTEIITYFKNYNDETKKMFAEIEATDEKELETKIGENLYIIISEYKCGPEGYVSEVIDKVLGIMKLWIEVEYFHNYTFIKTINAIYQDRFKRFLRVNDIDEIKNKLFYLGFLREYYIYIKENLIEKDLEYFFKYFTKQELEKFRTEIRLLKSKPETFLKGDN